MKNKGFTLIELLAVIVILAIIALIATPIILGIINDAREQSKQRTAELVAKESQLAYTSYLFKTAGESTDDSCKYMTSEYFEMDNLKCAIIAAQGVYFMIQTTIQTIAKALDTSLSGCNDSDISISGISIDSRTVQPGNLYIPIIRERVDGHTFLDGEDVSNLIRTPEVSKIVSPISSIVEVRHEMVNQQRKLAEGLDVIMEGRDITTVVFPNATYKYYLDASVECRAMRRFKQNQESGIDMSYDEILDNIKKRDYNDMHKEEGSLIRTDDQIYIDSTLLTIDEVVNEILKYIKER